MKEKKGDEGNCKKYCQEGRCGENPDLANACKDSCGPKLAKACNRIAVSQALSGSQLGEYQQTADDISSASGPTKDNLCYHNCSSSACKTNTNFGKFCVHNCKKKMIINCSKALTNAGVDLGDTGEDLFGVKPEHRDNALLIEKSEKANLIQKFIACSACTQKACSGDPVFRDKFCARQGKDGTTICPIYTTVDCGRLRILGTEGKKMMPKDVGILLEYLDKVGNERKQSTTTKQSNKGDWLTFANGERGGLGVRSKWFRSKSKMGPFAITEKDTYKEFNDLWSKSCTPANCHKSSTLQGICNTYVDKPYLEVRAQGTAIAGVKIKVFGTGVIPNGKYQCMSEFLNKKKTLNQIAQEKGGVTTPVTSPSSNSQATPTSSPANSPSSAVASSTTTSSTTQTAKTS